MSSKKTPERQENPNEHGSGFSRRTFLQGVGVGSGAVGSAVLTPQATAAPPSEAVGPGAVPMTLRVNGKTHQVSLEPRVTLLDALRNHLDYTGAKKVCDRATCGACTTIVDGNAVYSCTMLAIEAQGRNIETVESISTDDARMHPVQKYFVENDAQQCGFCTPGFVMACKSFLEKNSNPTREQVEQGLSGNICRCGTYVGVRQAVLDAAREVKGGRRA
ncbi:MAG: (2Fe-2S)-binding protein [Bryobacterales bacterium]